MVEMLFQRCGAMLDMARLENWIVTRGWED